MRLKRIPLIVLLGCLACAAGPALAGGASVAGPKCSGTIPTAVAQGLFAYQLAAISEYRAGHVQAANQTWRKAYDYARAHCWQSQLSSGDNLLRMGQARKAFEAYNSRLQPYDLLPGGYRDVGAVAPFQRGLEAGAAGDFSGSAAAFRSAINRVASDPGMRDSGFPEADFMLGASLFAKGQRAQAIAQWREALLHPGPPFPEEESFGPPSAWVSALNFYISLDP